METSNQSLNSTQSELKRLNEAHAKLQRQLDKQTEKNTKLENNMNGEIESRVGDIITERERMFKETQEIKEQLLERDTTIEKLKSTAKQRKTEYEKMSQDLEQQRGECNRANYKVKTLEKKLVTGKAQMDEKLEEIDKLYDETDMLKNTLE